MLVRGSNTRTALQKRIPAWVEAGVDVICIDSSEGFSGVADGHLKSGQRKYGDTVKIACGKRSRRRGFKVSAEASADFIKIGIGGGSSA